MAQGEKLYASCHLRLTNPKPGIAAWSRVPRPSDCSLTRTSRNSKRAPLGWREGRKRVPPTPAPRSLAHACDDHEQSHNRKGGN